MPSPTTTIRFRDVPFIPLMPLIPWAPFVPFVLRVLFLLFVPFAPFVAWVVSTWPSASSTIATVYSHLAGKLKAWKF